MRFTVPQFIEMEGKILGPLTFRQIIILSIPGTISFMIYLRIGKSNFFLFALAAIVLMGIGSVFAFLKIGGRDPLAVLSHLFKFRASPKTFIWQEKKRQALLSEEESVVKKEAMEGEISLKTGSSQIDKAKTQIK